jgi:hypothetical protein
MASITERLIALGWIWNKQGVLVNPKGSPPLSRSSDFIGDRYSYGSDRRSGGTFAPSHASVRRDERPPSTTRPDELGLVAAEEPEAANPLRS